MGESRGTAEVPEEAMESLILAWKLLPLSERGIFDLAPKAVAHEVEALGHEDGVVPTAKFASQSVRRS